LKIKSPPCAHCNGREFFTKRKDFQVGAYCQQCRRWIKWISKDLARELGEDFRSRPAEPVRLTIPTKSQPSIQVSDASVRSDEPSPGFIARIERLEDLVEKMDRELFVHTRILGQGPGPRRVRESFEREITDDQIVAFGRAVGGEG